LFVIGADYPRATRSRKDSYLANQKRKTDTPLEASAGSDLAGDFGRLQRVMRFFGRLRSWAIGHWLRSVLVAAVILVLIAATMAGWAYLASVALRSGEISIEHALEAFDKGEYEQARALVGQMLKSGQLTRSKYGGPLFVLGAIKTHDAEEESGADRRKVEYLVASRYLKEADTYGLPEGRELDGLYLLGKSLVESSQFDEGIHVLSDLLTGKVPNDHPLAWDTHRLLSNTYLLMPQSNPEKALHHAQELLKKPELTDEQRAGTLLQIAECFSRLERFDEARQAATAAPADTSRQADVALMQGKINLDEINAAFARVATQERKSVLDQSTAKIAEAMQHLQQARSLDNEGGLVTRQTSYHLGRGLQLQGESDQAREQFARTRQLYGDSLEGLAAALAEADLLRQKPDFEGAILGYRRVLEMFADTTEYRSVVLPLPHLRERLMLALRDFVDRKRFPDALVLLEHFPPLFTRAEQLELRGDTLERWGNDLIEIASTDDPQAASDLAAGRRHLRSAGLAFEQLAEVRFDSRFHSDDLWRSADNYFHGRSFSSAVRLLDKYLDDESELRNAEALLRLGEAHLALGQTPESIAAFEECIEFHPLSSSTFQARIDCAKAYWNEGKTTQAEQLLQDNLAATSLRPTSREWKDSLFELGMLLHEMDRHEDAIGTLEQAIERYPQDSQRLISQYLIGESYRRWAQELLDRTPQIRTESERNKNQQISSERLSTALSHFEEVQRTITLKTHDIHSDPLMGAMLRNCYMLEGTVLFDLSRYKEAIEAFSNVASLYPDEPFVLETFVQIASCWRRLNQNDKARGSIQQAQIALDRLPPDADFAEATSLNRDEWRRLLTDMSSW
jgi:tetratricopeptide (TPR) repeat protein